MSPLESSSDSIHFVTNGFRHLEAIEGVNGQGLKGGFDKGSPNNLR